MTCPIPEPVQETIKMIARLNLSTDKESRRVDFRTIRTAFSYKQQWSPKTLLTLLSFLVEKVPEAGGEQSSDLIQYIGDMGKEAMSEKQGSDSLRHRFSLLYILGTIMLAALASFQAAGDYAEFVPPVMRQLALVLIIAASVLIWFNKIRFDDIAEHLRNDSFTKEDCIYVYDNLPKKKLINKIIYGVGVVMILAAFIMTFASGRINKANLEERYAQVEASHEKNLQEIDALIEERNFADAWTKAEECLREAHDAEDALKMKSHTISETYGERKQKIVRSMVCGLWIGKSSNPDFPYLVFYISESDEGYWEFVTKQEFSAEELLQIVEQYKNEYYVPLKSVNISAGAKKGVFFSFENGKRNMEFTSFPDEALEIEGEKFLRVE